MVALQTRVIMPRGLRATVVLAFAAALVGVVGLTMMVGSGPSELTTKLHEWDAGYIQGLPDHLRRKEKLMDMRNNVGPSLQRHFAAATAIT